MSTLANVSKLAGVSESTASRASSRRGSVAEATKKRVSDAAGELGFVASSAAESLARERSRNIAVVNPFI
jgi:LacI family transcriptional regulator, repressor for deo operon, udp, cdd, tsx, nupC, and nupG